MKVCILAVTKAFDKYCIAGMDESGKWIRPISNSINTRFWNDYEITFKQGGFIRVGDVIKFQGKNPFKYQHSNHTEDYIVVSNKMELVKRLSNHDLIHFLEGKDESQEDFNNTVNARGRSLCLIKVNSFKHQVTQYPPEKPKPKMNFQNLNFNVTNPKTSNGDYIVKDCKWRNLVLNSTIINKQIYNKIYLALGLATPAPYRF